MKNHQNRRRKKSLGDIYLPMITTVEEQTLTVDDYGIVHPHRAHPAGPPPSADEVAAAATWLSTQQRSATRWQHSDSARSAAEFMTLRHVSDGAMIVAAYAAGHGISWCPEDDYTARIGIAKKSKRAIAAEARA